MEDFQGARDAVPENVAKPCGYSRFCVVIYFILFFSLEPVLAGRSPFHAIMSVWC